MDINPSRENALAYMNAAGISRDPSDPRTPEEIVRQDILTGSPRLCVSKSIGEDLCEQVIQVEPSVEL